MEGRLEIERLGGLAGFGLPGSRLRSRGQLDIAQLSAADRLAVDRLFDSPLEGKPARDDVRDAFRYRLTRQTAHGARTIEVSEQHVPAALKDCLSDELV